jgi:tRNA pseudouridine38-40 synthase
LEAALQKIIGSEITVHGSGRTDSGVHALGQVAHVDLPTQLPAQAIKAKLNPLLPADVRILQCAEVDAEFDARRSAIRREYVYRLAWGRDYALPLPAGHQWGYAQQAVRAEKLAEVGALFQGDHPFDMFRSSACEAKRTQLTIEKSEWHVMSDVEKETAMLPPEVNAAVYRVACRSFVMHMVRRLVGAAILYSQGHITRGDIEMALNQKQPLPKILLAPVQGLCLTNVCYVDDPFAPSSQ